MPNCIKAMKQASANGRMKPLKELITNNIQIGDVVGTIEIG